MGTKEKRAHLLVSRDVQKFSYDHRTTDGSQCFRSLYQANIQLYTQTNLYDFSVSSTTANNSQMMKYIFVGNNETL